MSTLTTLCALFAAGVSVALLFYVTLALYDVALRIVTAAIARRRG